jgi:DNA-binding IclR family transcriptional regulator
LPIIESNYNNQQPVKVRGTALEKAIVVLNAITSSAHAVSLAELAESIDMPRQTIHRVLQALSDTNLIIRAPNKDRYLVGPELTRMSARALRTLNTQPPVRSILEELVEETGETCNIGVLDQGEVIYIERLEGHSPLRLQLEVGSRVPGYCTAIGKLLIAYQHKNIRTRLIETIKPNQFTSRTLLTAESFEKAFSEIRANAYSMNNQEHVDGLIAVAVPIRDSDGAVIAGLAVHGSITRMDQDKLLSYLPGMRDKAERIAGIWSVMPTKQ